MVVVVVVVAAVALERSSWEGGAGDNSNPGVEVSEHAAVRLDASWRAGGGNANP